jgi:cytoskeleton protein RodZ
MSQEERLINGELLRLRREAQGWVVTDMALRACLSTKQVKQLEEGGTSAFYSESVKITAAKKVGSLLGLSADEVFASSTPPVIAQDALKSDDDAMDVQSHPVSVEAQSHVEQVVEALSTPVTVPPSSEHSVNEEVKSKTSVWTIAGLFVAALAVAAYLQPHEEPQVEVAPPLQVVPAEAEAAASAAEVAASAASAASAPVAAASLASPAASGTRSPGSAASAVSAVLPAAPAASKAP